MAKEFVKKQNDVTRAEVRGYIDDKNKVLLKALRSEMEARIVSEIRDRLQIPGIIGDNC